MKANIYIFSLKNEKVTTRQLLGTFQYHMSASLRGIILCINALVKVKQLLWLTYMCPISKEPFRTTGFHLTWTFSFWFQSTWTIHIKCYPVLSSKKCGTDDIPRLAAMPTTRWTLQEIYKINFPVISVTGLNFMIENTFLQNGGPGSDKPVILSVVYICSTLCSMVILCV